MSHCQLIERQGDAVADNAGLGCILARLNTRARRPAERLAGEGILEPDSLCCHPIQVGDDVQRLPVTPHSIPALLVTEYEQDIGSAHRPELVNHP
jgi:hypothetical protein